MYLRIALVFLLCSSFAFGEPLTVGVKAAPPFIVTDGEVTGFSAELMHEVAERMDPPREITFVVQENLAAHLEAVANGDVDMGIAATTITAEREMRLDFSHAFYESSQGVLVRQGRTSIFVLPENLQKLFFFLLVYIVVFAHIMWLTERGHKGFHNGYFRGVLDGLWWTIVTMSTVGYGDLYPRRGLGRVFAVVVIISGIMIFSVIVAHLTSALTVQQLGADVSTVGDLTGERVAVIEGTRSVEAARQKGMFPVEVASLDEGVALLKGGTVLGVVYDTPLLHYYLRSHPDDVLLLLETFDPAPYGIAFPSDSELREDVNVALLDYKESAPYQTLISKWIAS